MNRGLAALLAALFVLSGAAGLFYEAVWSRYLALFVGHDAYAQILTLVIYLGGMGVGALLVSRRTVRLRDPLFAFAVVEGLIGIFGLLFHDALYLPVTGWAYARLFPALGAGNAALLAKWALAALLILPQSLLLGASFPLMSAGALRRLAGRPGETVALLYFSNSLGAAAGVLIAGFWLYAAAGLPGTLVAAAMLNLGVALAALLVARARPGRTVPDSTEEVLNPTGLDLPALTRLLLILAAGTALASFIYEIVWIRMLSLVLGSSTHSFELMLSAFILGLALGAGWVRRRADRIADPLRMLAVVQLVMGGLAILSLGLYVRSFDWTAALLQATARSSQGYVFFAIARYALCMVIMLPATFCAGMTLPLMTRMLLTGGAGEAAIGTIYGANTIGSIVGAALTGLLLMPWLGLRGALVAGGALDMGLGLLLLRALARTGRAVGRLALAGSATLAGLGALALGVLPWDQALLSSGVFREGRFISPAEREMLFHADGRTASVHASRLRSSGTRILSTNGKADGSLTLTWFERCDTVAPRHGFGGDDGTQAMLALLMLAHAPAARTGAVIGHGTGMSSHLLLGSPAIGSLTTIEIEPAMREGARVFYPANRRAFDDPRGHLVIGDARAFFASGRAKFDLILSEPSNPWVSGVSGLFTTEFYRRLREYLAPGGVFGQWLHTYELNDGLVLSVLAALHANFADYRIFQIDGGDLLVVATPEGRLRQPDWSVTELPDIAHDLCRFLPIGGPALDRMLILDRSGLAPLVEQGVALNSDFYPTLDLGAERARFLRESAGGVAALGLGTVDYTAARPLSWDSSAVSALALTPRVRAMLVAGRLRQERPDSMWSDAPGASERYLLDGWQRQTAGGIAPVSWRGWAADFWRLRQALQGGDAPVDSTFFAVARRYAADAGAPPAVRAAIEFGAALAAADWPGAAAATGPLLDEVRAGRAWVPVDDLLDGAVRSLLAAGRPRDAGAAWELLRPRSARGPGDLRLALLKSYLDASDSPGAGAAREE